MEEENIAATFTLGVLLGVVVSAALATAAIKWLLGGTISGPLAALYAAFKQQGK
ncbi:MAG: hypothetical protein ABIM30_00065 [candidate division WOR-3 bacterium]